MADDAGIVARWKKTLSARRTEHDAALKQDKALHKLLAKQADAIRAAKRVIARHTKKTPALWNPGATRVPGRDAGPFISVPGRIVWHTTEGSTAEGAISAYRASGSWPHFTLDPRTGKLYQHLPVNLSGRALMHPTGVPETNRAHAIQVELVGFAKDTQGWPADAYARIATLARWIEANAGVARRCGVTFSGSVNHLTNGEWLKYSGHCGHQHVPGNDHHDPGAFRIDLVI